MPLLLSPGDLLSCLGGVSLLAWAAYRIGRRQAQADNGGNSRNSGQAGAGSAGERESDERRLLELQSRAIAASSNGIIIVAMSDGDARIVFVNPAWSAITGYAAAEVIGTRPGDLSRNDKDQPGLHKLAKVIASERAETVVLRNYRKDGSLFWNKLTVSPVHDGDGRLTHYLGILRDVSEQKQAQAELKSWAKRLAALSELSADGMLTIDRQDRVSYANAAFLRIFGLSEGELIGMDLLSLDAQIAQRCAEPGGYRAITTEMAQLSANPGGTPAPTEIRLRQPQARVLLRSLREATEETHLLLYFHDISAARAVEEAKSDFIVTAAHELRTPMSSILGFSEILLQQPFDAESSREALSIIARQAQRVSLILNELLDLSRIEARRGQDFTFVSADLRPLVDELLQTHPQQQRIIVIDLLETHPAVSIDRDKIAQAMRNIIDNALKFSPDSSPVTISLCRESSDAAARIGIIVADQGIGMTPAQLQRCGERFWRADPSGSVPGTGLGVALVREIVELHGGTLDIASEWNEGCRVSLWLPAAPAAAIGATGNGGARESAAGEPAASRQHH